MNKFLHLLFAIISLVSKAKGEGFQVDRNLLSGSYDLESNPGDDDNVRSNDGRITYISNNSWVAYQNFDFGAGASYFWIEGASPGAGGQIELRTGSENGPVIGTVTIGTTGNWSAFQPFGTTLSSSISGVHDLYFKFIGGGGSLFDTRIFRFQSIAPGLKQIGSLFSSASFDSEIAPSDPNTLRSESGELRYINDSSWAVYNGFDFGAEANFFMIEGAAPGKGGTVELRLDSAQGPLVGSVDISHTGSWAHYQPFRGVLSTSVSGVRDLYLRFVDSVGSGGYIFNTRNFMISREVPAVVSPYGADDDRDGVPGLLEYAFGMHPQSRDVIPLRMAPVGPVGGSGPYDIEVRIRADESLVVRALVSADLIAWDEVLLTFQNGDWQSDHPDITVSDVIPQPEGLSMIRLWDSRTHTKLFAQMAVDVAEGDLNVYPPVPGLDPSPYYTFSVQKLSGLNAASKENATNWQQPFAWFTNCVDQGTAGATAYYSGYIGGWSHTYCNFETAPHTPIVVKITRSNVDTGAPFGPITSAVARPAHKVISCEVINGEAYVTMSEPALIAVDIDGQMDSRNTPRATYIQGQEFYGHAFPHSNKRDGCHGVTIFANPVIKDKPVLGAPGVYAVDPGTVPPQDGSWTTLYFKPGVHKLSQNPDGSERPWVPSDPYYLINNKNYYIPGDAVVYGNFNDHNDQLTSENIRVFGHGTICGTKIPHFQDYTGLPPLDENKKLRILTLTLAKNCIFEGLTIADPPEHGIYIEGSGGALVPNFIKWVKNISWRVNNDGGGVMGNGYVEDCFFRHQDDALYVRGMAIRRTTFWSDVNGTPLRTSFIGSDSNLGPGGLPQDLVVEDCDIIYARGVFLFEGSTDAGIIGTPGVFQANHTYADGTQNTGQHVIFRNIRVSDPKPVRYLLGFNTVDESGSGTAGPINWAGIRFENIDFQYPQTWGWKNRLKGTGGGTIKYFTFDNVFINGTRLDAAYVNDPANFENSSVSELIFK